MILNNDQGASSEAPPSNPFGDFLSESIQKCVLNLELDLVVHTFEKGLQITVLYGESRKFSKFFSYEDLKIGETEKK